MSPNARTEEPRSRRLGLAAFGIILLVATLALPVLTAGMTVRSDDDITIAAGETIDDDLLVATDQFVLDGAATMDVVVAARDVDINGNVGGSLNAAAGTVTIRGDVAGSVRVFSGSVNVSGTIGGDLVVFGGTATVEPSGVVGGSVTMQGGTLTLRGTVSGNVSGSMEQISIDGPIAGDVDVRAGDVNIGPEGTVDGDVSYVSRTEADIATEAKVGGTVDRKTIAPWGSGDTLRDRFFSPLVRTLWMLVAGAIIVGLAPRLASTLDENMRRPLAALIMGAIALIAIPIVALVLAITIVGIPASMILFGLYLAGLYLSQYVVGQRLGTLILPDRWNDGSRGYLLLSMTIGVLLLSLLRYLHLPYVGSVLNLLVAIVGLGAAVLLIGQLRPSARTWMSTAR
jgi:cytoskeletal protein CcmA (bactofilin family)